jgi:hypothetical protein
MPIFANLPERRRKDAAEKAAKDKAAQTEKKTTKKDEVTNG